MIPLTPTTAGRFAEFVARQPANLRAMPLVHSSRCETFFEIARSDCLTPHHCGVFGEPLVYFFYGRPAYQSKRGSRPTTEITFFPVSFVFKPALAWPDPAGIFPFDSGAADGGKFRPHVTHAKYTRYELKQEFDSARRLVERYFSTNGQYYSARATPGLTLPTDQEEASRYYQLISSAGETSHDDRRSTVELRFKHAVPLADRLLTVILPEAFLQPADIFDAVFARWKVSPIAYPTYNGAIPSHFKPVIFDRLKQLLEREGCL